jgi:hypothetical protein
MNKKQMASLEKYLNEQFPNSVIHVRADVQHEFVISGDEVVYNKERIWAVAEAWFLENGYGGVNWGKPRYVSA